VKDSKQTEKIEGAHSLVIPFTLEEKWLFARVGQECMRWTSAKLYALEHARTPVQSVQKISLTQQERRTMRRKGLKRLRLRIEQYWVLRSE
jgi:hypothetical protein